MAKKKKEEEENPKIKAYVVLSQHFEYDDNYYNSQDGGTPVKVFLNRDKAEEEAARKNIVEICGCNLDNYSYNLREGGIEVFEQLKAVVKSAKGKITSDGGDEDRYNIKVSLPDDVKLDYVREILDILGIWFHSVEEVDVDVDI